MVTETHPSSQATHITQSAKPEMAIWSHLVGSPAASNEV